MNCCDDYGQCDQGHDCPARKKDPLDIKPVSFDQIADLLIVLISVVMTLVLIMVSIIGFYFWSLA